MFLTQDATPAERHGSRAWSRRSTPTARVGLSFGPHLPRPDTSPMIARELTEFFASFADGRRADRRPRRRRPSRRPASSRTSTPRVLRACWEEVRFRDVAYAEDQAFARDAMAAGWRKAYVPGAGVLHAHDYPFARVHAPLLRRVPRAARDDRPRRAAAPRARGAHGARAGARRPALHARRRASGAPALALGRCARARHHAGRALFASALGSRAERLPPALAQPPVARGPRRGRQPAGSRSARAERRPYRYEYVRDFTRAAARAAGRALAARRDAGAAAHRLGRCRRSGAAAAAT